MMQTRVLNLNDVIASLHKLLARLVGEDIALVIRQSDGLWPVRADPGQIEQVLMNLAANARDAMPEGGTLAVDTANVLVDEEGERNRPGLRPGAYVTMTVVDTGVGVPDNVVPHIFEPFFTTKEQGKGTGLGLATVYGIIKQMGGGVYLESEEGKGTRFLIYLPRVPETVDPPA
jgi:signal transduction histidine kinase